jgi:arylsulfatase A-like enzyme
MRLNTQEINPDGHATDLFSDWAASYIESRQKHKNPFFLYLAYNAPHDPIQPPADWLTKVKDRQTGITDKRAKLIALIEHMDAGIGKVITSLKKTGNYNNTIIFFVSDNGGRLDLGANNGSVRSGKGSMYEGGLKVPACITWPQKIKAGSATNELALTMDIFPTILQATGTVYGEKIIDGISLYPLATAQTETLPERAVFFCRREGDAAYGGKMIDAVRKGDWKLLQNFPFNARELYNLKEDPLEQNNLILKEDKKFREMEALMRAHIQRSGSVPWQ